MSVLVCPNISLPAWQQLEAAVGRMEATRDYLETGGEIRTPDVVIRKIQERTPGGEDTTDPLNEAYKARAKELMDSYPDVYNTLEGYNPYISAITEGTLDVNASESGKVFAVEAIKQLAQGLSDRTQVRYEIVSSDLAAHLTKNSRTPWNGEPAFFTGGTVYLVGDRVTPESVFHEFSHPVVRAISKSNPDLFTALYTKLQSSKEGAEVIARVTSSYPELVPGSEQFIEEAIVTALSSSALADTNHLKQSAGFTQIVKNILFAVRQFLRKVFGMRIRVEKLDAGTTLAELSSMLKGDLFSLDTDSLSDEDVVSYIRDQRRYIADLEKVSSEALQASTNRFFDMVMSQIQTVQGNKNYKEMAEILADEFDRGDLQEIRSNLSAYQTTLDNKMAKLRSDVEFTRNHLEAFVNSLFRLDQMARKVHEHIVEVSKNPDNLDNLNKVYYYNRLITYWKKFIEETKDIVTQEGMPVDAPGFQLLNTIESRLDQSKQYSDKVYTAGVKDVINEQLLPMKEQIDKKYTGLIEHFNNRKQQKLAKGQSAKTEDILISRYTKEYEELKLTPEKTEKLLKGELGDAHALNSFMEGYLYNQDPVVAGFAMYVNNNITDVLTTAQRKFNEFSDKMAPLLEKAGYNPSNIAQLGQQLTFTDRKGYRDKEGNFAEKKVFTFLNPFKDYRLVKDEYKFKIEKAKEQYLTTHSQEDYKAYIDLAAEYQKHLRQYFHQEYIDDFYAKEDILLKDDIGIEAKDRRDSILEKIRLLGERFEGEMDAMENTQQIDALWGEYRLLFSLIDLNGDRKTGKELQISERLREYRERSKNFYEWKERKGVFQNALLNYEQQLADSGIAKGTEEFTKLRTEWILKNTRTVIKPEFYVYRNTILQRMREIVKNLPSNVQNQLAFDKAWSDIIDAVSGYRDEDGQPKGSEIPEGRAELVRRRQQEINDLYGQWAGLTGLTKSEAAEIEEYYAAVEGAKQGTNPWPSKDAVARFKELMARKNELGLTKFQRQEFNALIEQLRALQSKEATDYYVDVFNNYLTKINTDPLEVTIRSRAIDKSTADAAISPDVIEKLISQDEGFSKWFLANHVKKEKYDKITGETTEVWERSYIWSVIRPRDSRFVETTQLKDESGNVTDTIPYTPGFKYMTRQVKPEFRTKKVPTGVDPDTGEFVTGTVDNLGGKGYFLPKTVEQGAPDDRYINKEYYRLQRENPNLFKVLQELTVTHLKNQEGLGMNSKLYLDIPRFRKSSLEALQSIPVKDRIKQNPVSVFAKQLRDFFRKSKDDWEQGYNYKQDEFTLVKADMFDDEVSGIPIAGLYDLELDQVSLDLTNSMTRYMLSAERQKKLVEMSPVARALQQVMRDPKTGVHKAIKDTTKVNKFNFLNRGVATYLNKKGRNVRASAIDALIEREFEGQNQAGFTKDMKWLNAISTLLFRRASFGFFAMNIPSALKNSFGQMFQTAIESAAGTYLNPVTYAKGIGWAGKASTEISAQLYKRTSKSLNVQLVEIFDPSQGRLEDKIGESLSRTIVKDAASMSWIYNTRKWTELNATLQMFGGMMYHQKLEMTDPEDGTKKEISYIDAWELRDGQISLRKGIDPEWGVEGKKFKEFRNTVQQVGRRLNGAYDKFNQPEAQRYLAYRFISYLNRYFTTMLVNRWGFRGSFWSPKARYDIGTSDVAEGWYITTIKSLITAISSGGKSLPYMTPTERSAFLRVFSEVGMLSILSMLMPLLFNWDPDDDERLTKLREKSGSLPGPLVAQSDYAFNLSGWLENHALNLVMQVRAENEQWVPTPGMGLDDYKRKLDVSSLAFGPTIDAYVNIFQDVFYMATDDPSAQYKREVGPYIWQQQGGRKILAHFAKTVGLTGSTVDPVVAIKNFTSVQARTK